MFRIAQPDIGEEEKKAVLEVMDSGMIAQGPEVEALEKEFANYCGVKFAVATSSGTSALHTALYSIGIDEGDEVITTPFTFVATANSILMQRAKVVFADINEDDFNLDPQAVAKKITPHTKAILPVDLYGQPYRVKEMNELAKEHGLKIIEDGCQAVGASYENKKAGALGDIGAFSLYATKNIMCGEGGMLVTDDANAAERAKQFRHHGQSGEVYKEYSDLGYNYRMTDLAAAIALVQLKKADALNQKRAEYAARLSEGLSEIKGIITPYIKENCKHVFHLYTLRITQECKITREELAKRLQERGIGCGVYYPKPLHLHKHFMRQGYKQGDFPHAEKMSSEVLSLPCQPGLTLSDINLIIETAFEYAV